MHSVQMYRLEILSTEWSVSTKSIKIAVITLKEER